MSIRDQDRTAAGTLPQTKGIAADVKRRLRHAGYLLEPPKASAEAIRADNAVAAAQAEYGASGATRVAVERQTVTTPDMGRLVNLGDPEQWSCS